MSKKYFVVSDLHLEFRQGQERSYWEAFPEHKEARVCLCAGDVTTFGLPSAIWAKHFLGLCDRFEKVLYVPGNHEYYGSNPSDGETALKTLEVLLPNLTVLRAGQPYTFDGQRFLGDTMWFPDRPEVHMYKRMISDSSQIKNLFPWAFTQSSLFLNYLREQVTEDDIIITHHIPNDVDTRAMWRNNPTQAYFMNRDCDQYWQHKGTVKPKAWIYGHTHDKHDYWVGKTHFVCNPVGYPGENHHFPEAAEPALYEI